MGKNLRDMTRQEQTVYFKSKDYCGEQLKVVMDAISYGISADYLRLFEDTTIPVETMENMFTAMKEDYGAETVMFLSTVHKEESGRIILEALKYGVPLSKLQKIYQKGMLPIELREKILPLMQGREAIPEKIGERMDFITEAVRDLKESFSRQNSFIEDLKKSMEEKADIFSPQAKDTEAVTESVDDSYYLELEEQFRQAREDAERLLEEREETNKRIRELEAENKHLHEQLLIQQSYVAELQEQRKMQENREVQVKGQTEIENSRMEMADYRGISKKVDTKSDKQSKFPFSFNFPFNRRKPGLLEKLAGELDAGQIAEIRLGIEDGLTEGQLALLADKDMDAEKIRELRMTMK
ncbi:MAG: hypothetical protein K2N82_13255, partial [Lachnospiraceae bacterium]|nr:hypothetical protein [Lachnospiraceae bacterium]